MLTDESWGEMKRKIRSWWVISRSPKKMGAGASLLDVRGHLHKTRISLKERLALTKEVVLRILAPRWYRNTFFAVYSLIQNDTIVRIRFLSFFLFYLFSLSLSLFSFFFLFWLAYEKLRLNIGYKNRDGWETWRAFKTNILKLNFHAVRLQKFLLCQILCKRKVLKWHLANYTEKLCGNIYVRLKRKRSSINDDEKRWCFFFLCLSFLLQASRGYVSWFPLLRLVFAEENISQSRQM